MGRIYSHTLLENLAACPPMGKHATDYLHRPQKTGPSRQGVAAHAVGQALFDHLRRNGLDGDKEAGELLVSRACASLSPLDAAGIRPSLMRFVEQDFPWARAADALCLETTHYVGMDGRTVDNPHTHLGPVFRYTTDVEALVGHCVHLRDLKFGWNITHVDDPAENRQLKRYAAAIALSDRYDMISSVMATIHHGRYGYEPEPAEWGVSELRDAWEELVVSPIRYWEKNWESIGKIAEDYVLGMQCRDCDMRGACPAYQMYPQDPQVGWGVESMLTAAAIWEAKARDLKSAVVPIIERDGPVVAGDYQATVVQKTEIKFDPGLREALKEFLPDRGLDIIFTASRTSIEKGLTACGVPPEKRREMMADLIEKHGVKTVLSTYVKIGRKPKGKPRKRRDDDDERYDGE